MMVKLTKLKQQAEFAKKDIAKKTHLSFGIETYFLLEFVISFLVWRSEKCREKSDNFELETSGLNNKT